MRGRAGEDRCLLAKPVRLDTELCDCNSAAHHGGEATVLTQHASHSIAHRPCDGNRAGDEENERRDEDEVGDPKSV